MFVDRKVYPAPERSNFIIKTSEVLEDFGGQFYIFYGSKIHELQSNAKKIEKF